MQATAQLLPGRVQCPHSVSCCGLPCQSFHSRTFACAAVRPQTARGLLEQSFESTCSLCRRRSHLTPQVLPGGVPAEAAVCNGRHILKLLAAGLESQIFSPLIHLSDLSVRRYYQEVCLLEQPFVMDDTKRIQDVIKVKSFFLRKSQKP